VIRTWGEKRVEPKLKNHVDLVDLLGIADLKKGLNLFIYSSKIYLFINFVKLS
jgi:seryl-tRNA synthetase